MNIQLSQHFTYGKLLRFALPSIVMMAFSSIYGVVDGVFVSNYVGADPFAAVNLIMPFLMILGAVGFMLGTGGSALVAYMLGVGNERKANETFSLLMYVLITLGAIFTVLGLLFLESGRPPAWRGRDTPALLRELWARHSHRAHPLHAAKRVPELPRDGGAAALRPVYHDRRGRDEHRARRAVHRGAAARRGRRGSRHNHQPVYRRRDSAALLHLSPTRASSGSAARGSTCGAIAKAGSNGASEFMTQYLHVSSSTCSITGSSCA